LNIKIEILSDIR